jgi:2-keto-4-pentenoate hydratase/2-oxohepta-3-ene-1,7-dioic acid hydratase in catechol pathway
MKITRYMTPNGRIGYGSLEPDGTVLALEGDVMGELRATGRRAEMATSLAPVEPSAIIGVGLNYRRHAEEGGMAIPQRPVVFQKTLNTVQHPGAPILIPTHLPSEEVDYECELAVVLGRGGKNIPCERALDHVLGYTCANDVSARDWQLRMGGGQWGRGKMFDTFCPLGPVLVTPDEIPNPNRLQIRTRLNDEFVQDWNTADMIFDVPTLISFLSGSTTLQPGTVILTGTPHGVGMARKPPRWLRAGDSVTIDIEGIGSLTNPVAPEESSS